MPRVIRIPPSAHLLRALLPPPRQPHYAVRRLPSGQPTIHIKENAKERVVGKGSAGGARVLHQDFPAGMETAKI
jgi:hypothetical protein